MRNTAACTRVTGAFVVSRIRCPDSGLPVAIGSWPQLLYGRRWDMTADADIERRDVEGYFEDLVGDASRVHGFPRFCYGDLSHIVGELPEVPEDLGELRGPVFMDDRGELRCPALDRGATGSARRSRVTGSLVLHRKDLWVDMRRPDGSIKRTELGNPSMLRYGSFRGLHDGGRPALLGIVGDGSRIWGSTCRLWGDVSYISGNVSGLYGAIQGDVSMAVGSAELIAQFQQEPTAAMREQRPLR